MKTATLKTAQHLGAQAFANGINAPVADPAVMKLTEGMQIGEGAPIYKAWIKGWTVAMLDAPVAE